MATFGQYCLLDDAFMVKLFGATLKKAVKKDSKAEVKLIGRWHDSR
jgi:hypothetical protein